MVIYHNINPTIIDLGPLEIRWYGLFYIFGFAAAYYMIPWLAKKRGIRLSKEQVMDFLTYAAFGVILGGRLGYVIFYDFLYYLARPLEIFAIWQGGMSFHGGLIGVSIAGLLFCRKNKVRFLDLADVTVFPLALALALGRLGNFINGELYGRINVSTFCIDYTKSQYMHNPPEGCRYPSQLFESAKNLVIFSILWAIRNHNLPRGFLFFTFIALYGSFRFMIEFTRQPDSQIGLIAGLSLGQWLCLPMIIIGLVMLVRLKK